MSSFETEFNRLEFIFSFSSTGYHAKVKEPICSTIYLSLEGK